MSALPHIQPPTYFDRTRYVPIKEAAEALGLSEGHLRRKCLEQLAANGAAIKAVSAAGEQDKWLILRDCNPRLSGGTIGQLYADPDLSGYTLKQQQGARNRRICVEELRKLRADASVRMAQAEPALLEQLRKWFPDLRISRTRLRAWDAIYSRPADLDKLIDRRGGDRRSQGTREAWKVFTDLFLHENCPTIKQCWQETGRIAAARGWSWCTLKSCHSQLNDRIPNEIQIQHRQPEKYRTAMQPTIAQYPEAWPAGACWIGDHKQLDLWCIFGETIIRPWLTAWMDWRTRRVCGWVLSANPNSSTILAALRHGIMEEQNMGGPGAVWIDNGKDYDAWVFHGQTKRERLRKLHVVVDEPQAGGIFHALRIEAHFSLAYNPNGKSRLERWFRSLTPFFKTFETYAGEGVENRPERLNDVLSKPGLIPPFKDVQERIAAHIAGYNASADHEKNDLAEGGQTLSADEAMAMWCTTKRVYADPAALDLLLEQWQKPLTVGRNGIAINIQGQTLHYGQFEPALRPFKGLHKSDRKLVRVAYDSHDVRTIRVYDEQFRFVCTARMNDQGGLHAGDPVSQEKVADLNRQKAHYRKATKHVAEYGITSVLTNEEALAASANKPKPAAEPTTLKIVRTPVDGQAKEVQREQFRKAVGAEGMGTHEHSGLSAFEQLRQRQQEQQASRDDEGFVSDPWSLLRRGQ